MKVRVGSNVAVVAVFFGASLFDSVHSRLWLEALLFAALLGWALVQDSRGKSLSSQLKNLKRHEDFDIDARNTPV
jgi:endonuclease III-like uncharacterized protein